MIRHTFWSAVAVAALLPASCSRPEPRATEPELGGDYGPVRDADMGQLRLNGYFAADGGYHDADFGWTFTESEFVVRAGTGRLPAGLLGQLLLEGSAADEIRGRWELIGGRPQQLRLTQITPGGAAGRAEVRLKIYKTAPTVVRIGQPQYAFSLKR